MSIVGDRVKLVRNAIARGLPSIGDLARLASGDGTKALFGDGSFQTPDLAPTASAQVIISHGSIGSPATSLDVAIPSGYDQQQLLFTDLLFSPTDSLAFVVSADAGATWISDAINANSYTSGLAVGVLFQSSPLVDVYTGRIVILPGSSHYLFGMRTEVMTYAATGNAPGGDTPGAGDDGGGGAGLYPRATVPPVMQRYNKIRFFPQGNQDFPPTSGNTFTGGRWILIGTATQS